MATITNPVEYTFLLPTLPVVPVLSDGNSYGTIRLEGPYGWTNDNTNTATVYQAIPPSSAEDRYIRFGSDLYDTTCLDWSASWSANVATINYNFEPKAIPAVHGQYYGVQWTISGLASKLVFQIHDRLGPSQGLTGLGPVGGSTGLQGLTGLQGIQGQTGFYGQTGLQGGTGLIGGTGIQGLQGLTGFYGQTGLFGPTGIQGGTGIQGQTGIQGGTGFYGQTGIQGTTGFYGQTGIRGHTGLGIQGETGFYGQTGFQGITGISGGGTGLQGPTGIKGGTGIQGGTGIIGLIGGTGIQGVTGLVGGTGIQGGTGILGVTGFVGGTGVQGITGLVGGTGVHGVTGLVGGTGIQGITGFYGQTGIIGNQGSTGLANFIDTDLQPLPVINLTPVLLWSEAKEALYMGATGIGTWIQISAGSLQGGTGFQGVTGIYGKTGIQGVTGIYGETGIQGGTGIRGVTGFYGGTGIQGITGLANFIDTDASPLPVIDLTPVLLWSDNKEALYMGATGIGTWVQISAGALQGGTGFGVSGKTGIQGMTGFTGGTGIQGETGIQGVTGLVGGTGIQGVTGLVGGTGIQGVTGLIGETGIQGVTGIFGQTGIQGGTGIQGETGIRGVTGLALGQTGIQGVTGLGDNVRSFTFNITNPSIGGVLGPRLKETNTATEISAATAAASGIVFNFEQRTNAGTTGLQLMAASMLAGITGMSTTTLQNTSMTNGKWVWLDIQGVTGAVGQATFTIATVV